MLRANKLKNINCNINKNTSLDLWLQSFGGTIYQRCYTPAPDTPRSLACLYSGRYPKRNGCINRIQWPKYYLNKTLDNIFDLFNHEGFEIFSNFQEEELITGILPNNANIKNYKSLKELLYSIPKESDNNQLFFINIPDYHTCVDDYYGLPISAKIAYNKIINSFNQIFAILDKESIDYSFIFSDHGCILTDDEKNEYPIKLLDDNRSKIYLQVKKMHEKTIKYDNKICSIMDIYPTLMDIFKHSSNENIDGISLFKEENNRCLILEDQSKFPPGLGGYHDLWGYRDKNYFYLESLEQKLLLKEVKNSTYKKEEIKNTHLMNKIKIKLQEDCASYKEIKKQTQILESYKLISYSLEEYTDGSKRISNTHKIIMKLISRFANIYFKLNSLKLFN